MLAIVTAMLLTVAVGRVWADDEDDTDGIIDTVIKNVKILESNPKADDEDGIIDTVIKNVKMLESNAKDKVITQKPYQKRDKIKEKEWQKHLEDPEYSLAIIKTINKLSEDSTLKGKNTFLFLKLITDVIDKRIGDIGERVSSVEEKAKQQEDKDPDVVESIESISKELETMKTSLSNYKTEIKTRDNVIKHQTTLLQKKSEIEGKEKDLKEREMSLKEREVSLKERETALEKKSESTFTGENGEEILKKTEADNESGDGLSFEDVSVEVARLAVAELDKAADKRKAQFDSIESDLKATIAEEKEALIDQIDVLLAEQVETAFSSLTDGDRLNDLKAFIKLNSKAKTSIRDIIIFILLFVLVIVIVFIILTSNKSPLTDKEAFELKYLLENSNKSGPTIKTAESTNKDDKISNLENEVSKLKNIVRNWQNSNTGRIADTQNPTVGRKVQKSENTQDSSKTVDEHALTQCWNENENSSFEKCKLSFEAMFGQMVTLTIKHPDAPVFSLQPTKDPNKRTFILPLKNTPYSDSLKQIFKIEFINGVDNPVVTGLESPAVIYPNCPIRHGKIKITGRSAQKDTKIPLNEDYLTAWWKENSANSYDECKKDLEERFRDIKKIECAGEPEDSWQGISIESTAANFMLPGVDTVYDKTCKEYFDVKGEYKLGESTVSSLIRPARRDNTNGNFFRGEIGVTNPSKPALREDKLIEWWSENALNRFTECKNSLKARFGDKLEFVLLSSIETSAETKAEEWLVFGVTEPLLNEYFVLPRKNDFVAEIAVWFRTDGKPLNLIDSLVQLAKAGKNRPEICTDQGVVVLVS